MKITIYFIVRYFGKVNERVLGATSPLLRPAKETVSHSPKVALSSRTNVRDLRKISRFDSKQGFLLEFTLSLAEGIEMTERRMDTMFSLLRHRFKRKEGGDTIDAKKSRNTSCD
jgi:hypothetical protein